MKFWLVMAALLVCVLLFLDSPRADEMRNEEVELRPVAQTVQNATGANNLMSGMLPLVAIGTLAVVIISRFFKGGGGGMSHEARVFIATVIAVLVMAALLG
jgi:hypothetical protein